MVALAVASVATIVGGPTPAAAQFVGGGSATGAEPQLSGGSTATGLRSVACGIDTTADLSVRLLGPLCSGRRRPRKVKKRQPWEIAQLRPLWVQRLWGRARGLMIFAVPLLASTPLHSATMRRRWDPAPLRQQPVQRLLANNNGDIAQDRRGGAWDEFDCHRCRRKRRRQRQQRVYKRGHDGDWALSRAGATADGQINATAVGFNSQANAVGASTLGANSTASGELAVAVGDSATASAFLSTATGTQSSALGI